MTKPPAPSLSDLQMWMKNAILQNNIPDHTDLQEIENAIDEEIFCSGNGIEAKERLAIYSKGYRIRLLECLRADYPILCKLLGDKLFNYFGLSYLSNHPSSSFTIFDFGKDFPAFLESTKPGDEKTDEINLLPIDIARFERLKVELLRKKGTEGMALSYAIQSPLEIFEGKEKYKTPPSLGLLALNFPLIEFVKKINRGEIPPVPEFKKTKLVVCRKNFKINMSYLQDWQFIFLESLIKKPQTLNDALEIANRKTNLPLGEMMAELMLWMPLALSNGYMLPAGN